MEECQILTTRNEVEALATEWNALGARTSIYCFSDYESTDTWMRTVGQYENNQYHIITCRRKGHLTGLLPLIVTEKRGIRLLRWVGHDVFFGPIQLYETEADREALWRTALASPHYDCAKIKYVFAGTPEERLIPSLPTARRTETDKMTFTTYGPKGGTGWYDNLSSNMRKEHRRKLHKLEKIGKVTYRTTRGGPVSYGTVMQMVEYKKQWTQAHNKQSGIFHSPQFMQELVRQAEAKGTLVLTEVLCKDEPLAMGISFEHGETLFGYMITHNPKWDKYSAGTIEIVETIRWTGDNGFKCLHLFEGSDPYKNRYTNGHESFGTYLWATTWRGRAVIALYTLARFFKKFS